MRLHDEVAGGKARMFLRSCVSLTCARTHHGDLATRTGVAPMMNAGPLVNPGYLCRLGSLFALAALSALLGAAPASFARPIAPALSRPLADWVATPGPEGGTALSTAAADCAPPAAA